MSESCPPLPVCPLPPYQQLSSTLKRRGLSSSSPLLSTPGPAPHPPTERFLHPLSERFILTKKALRRAASGRGVRAPHTRPFKVRRQARRLLPHQIPLRSAPSLWAPLPPFRVLLAKAAALASLTPPRPCPYLPTETAQYRRAPSPLTRATPLPSHHPPRPQSEPPQTGAIRPRCPRRPPATTTTTTTALISSFSVDTHTHTDTHTDRPHPS